MMKFAKRLIVNLSFLLSVLLLLINAGFAQENSGFSEVMDLGQIVVTPSKISLEYGKSTQNVSIVEGSEIRSSAALGVDKVLDSLPSVNIGKYGGAGANQSIHIRGASSAQALVLVDGRPLNTPRDGQADLNQINLANIEKVEVLRGPASSIYGSSAMGGVVNVITKRGSKDMRTQLSTKFGSFATKEVLFSHGYKVNSFDYFISHQYLASHGHRGNSDYLTNKVDTKLGYQFNDNNELIFSAGYSNTEKGTPYTVQSQDLDDHQETFDRYYDLTYKGRAFGAEEFGVKLFHNIDRLEFVESWHPLDKDAHQSKVYGLDMNFSYRFFDKLRSTFGYTYQDNKLNSNTSGKHKYDFKAAYLETEFDLADNFDLTGGLRWDDYSNFGDRLSPRTGFNFWFTNNVKLHCSYSRSFRAPTFNDLYWPTTGRASGNPDLTPEKAWSGEAGISAFFNQGKVELTLFKTRYEDLIQWEETSPWFYQPSNVGAAVTQGVELDTEWNITDKFKTGYNYTYLEAKDLYTKKWLTYRPRHLHKIKLNYSPSSKWKIGVEGKYRTKTFADSANTDIVEHYLLMDFNTTYQVSDSLKLMFTLENLFDRNYHERKGYSMPRRAFYGGFQVSF